MIAVAFRIFRYASQRHAMRHAGGAPLEEVVIGVRETKITFQPSYDTPQLHLVGGTDPE